MHQQPPMDLQAVRQIIARVVSDEAPPTDVVRAARASVSSMCREAAEQGLTTADVLRALLRPVFARKQECDCATCIARRADVRQRRVGRQGKALVS